MKPVVAIRQCPAYHPEKVQRAVGEAVEAAGPINELIKPGDRVLLKVNLLNAALPERAVTTHPEVTRAMIRLVKDAGGIPIVGDAPGIDLPGNAKKVLKTSGTFAVCQEEGMLPTYFTDKGYVRKKPEKPLRMDSINIARAIVSADVVISLAKAKTHMLTLYTGAIKNLFGVLPQSDRKIAHALPDPVQFAESLVDIFSVCSPDFALMDAIVGMEGRGPSDGTPRNLGLVLASKDLVALDTITAAAMGLDRLDIPHIRIAAEQALGENNRKQIAIDGPKIEDVRQEFEPPPTSAGQVPGFVNKLAMRLWVVDPIISDACVLCGHCASICPTEAITQDAVSAKIDYDKCIRCFCCHELCPFSAVKEKPNLVVRLVRYLGERKMRRQAAGDPPK
jgi:uncharacterized protein (DUF362 family)/Pyruvate/2-oxoacid:ferredoxin oxidoreductase delta subunit